MNIPFAVYILSPAIASYIVLKKHNRIANFKDWLKTVFYFKNSIHSYVFVVAGLTVYFLPLFLIPGTNHGEGLINFWMFAVQLLAFRFFNGAIYKISGRGCVFMCVLFHTLFNAASPIFGTMTMTCAGTIAANTVLVLISIIAVMLYEKKINVS